MFGPLRKFIRILISRLIFDFLTGFKILTTILSEGFCARTPWKTSEYFPLPIFSWTLYGDVGFQWTE